MKSRAVLSAVLAFCLCSICQAFGAAPSYIFKEGQTLSYKISEQLVNSAGTSQAVGRQIEGTATFRMLSKDRGGTARILLTASGTGKVYMEGGKTVLPMQDAGTLRVILFVKPNGAIVRAEDEGGQQIGLQREIQLISKRHRGITGASAVLSVAAGRYSLFGIELPESTPKAGRKWTGHYRKEASETTSDKTVKMTFQSVPVEYTYLGKEEHAGKMCLKFSYRWYVMRKGGDMDTFTAYFDAGAGQLVAQYGNFAKKDIGARHEIKITLIK